MVKMLKIKASEASAWEVMVSSLANGLRGQTEWQAVGASEDDFYFLKVCGQAWPEK